jgi:hypothetical protein
VKVSFKRTGIRRYAVIVVVSGESLQAMDPAPGYDDDIPHDLVHYVVEAELGLTHGVFGRTERGAGTFVTTRSVDSSPRQRAREQRKRQRREQALDGREGRGADEMATSERIAAIADVVWRRKHHQSRDPLRSPPVVRSEDAPLVGRVVARLDALAPLWRDLPIGNALVFEWPELTPRKVLACSS